MENSFGWGKWEVRIRRPIDRLGGEVYICRHNNAARETQMLNVGKDGTLTAYPVKAGEAIVAPTFSINDEHELRGIMQAFSEAADELGVKRPDDSHNAGKLEATEKHLEDMRKFAFKGMGCPE